MLLPSRLLPDHLFRPFQSSPARDLLRDCLIDENGTTRLLLLGCGDISSIVYTLSNHLRHILTTSAALDVALCDMDAAVLARNILIFTLLVDSGSQILTPSDPSAMRLWNIYFHFFVDKQDLDLVQAQARKLLAASASLSEWESSAYGRLIKFFNTSSLTGVHTVFNSYATPLDFSTRSEYGKEFTASFRATVNPPDDPKHQAALKSVRAAGMNVAIGFKVLGYLFENYCMTGICTHDIDDMTIQTQGYVNPLLAMSTIGGQGRRLCSCPRTTFPLGLFHLQHCFAHPWVDSTIIAPRCVAVAKEQWLGWCSAFVQVERAGLISMRFHWGEALNLAHEMLSLRQHHARLAKDMFHFDMPLSTTPLQLFRGIEPNTSLRFDVIETGNLADHAGCLNIIVATIPLLRQSLSSVMYIEVSQLDIRQPKTWMARMLGLDPKIASLIIGAAPSEVLTGATTEISISDRNSFFAEQQHARSRISWRLLDSFAASAVPKAVPHTSFSPSQLAEVFATWTTALFSSGPRVETDPRRAIANDLTELTSQQVSEGSSALVGLLRLASVNINTEWKHFLDNFLEAVDKPEIPLLRQRLTELKTMLVLNGIVTSSRLNLLNLSLAESRDCSILEIARAHDLCYMTLEVPCASLELSRPFDMPSRAYLLSVLFQSGSEPPHVFTTLIAAIGRLKHDAEDSTAAFTCNPLETDNSESLIIFCPLISRVAAQMYASGVTVCLQATISKAGCGTMLSPAVGAQTQVMYTTPINKKNEVRFLRALPLETPRPDKSVQMCMKHQRCGMLKSLEKGTSEVHARVSLKADQSIERIWLEMQLDLSKRKLPANIEKQMVVAQYSPLAFHFAAPKLPVYNLAFPMPVATVQCQPHLEGSSPMMCFEATPANLDGMDLNSWTPHKVIGRKSNALMPSLGNFDSDTQRLIPKLAYRADFVAAISMTKSVQYNEDVISEDARQLLNVELMMNNMILTYLDKESEYASLARAPLCFVLPAAPRRLGLVVAVAARYDSHGSSFFLDAFYVPASVLTAEDGNLIHRLHHRKGLSTLDDALGRPWGEGESRNWKGILPILVERCRVGWKHQPDCGQEELDVIENIKLTLEGPPDLCTCGAGKDTASFPAELGHLVEHAVRIAICPLYPAAYSCLNNVVSAKARYQYSSGEYAQEVKGPSRVESQQFVNDGTAGPSSKGCAWCGREQSDLKTCKRCQTAQYCNHDCQKEHWRLHKKRCKEAKK